jgi:hypothetical protein
MGPKKRNRREVKMANIMLSLFVLKGKGIKW